jgi:carbon storage regulator
MMLILSLKVSQKVHIGGEVSVMVVKIKGGQVHIGIEAPQGLLILRDKNKKGHTMEGASQGKNDGSTI